MPESSQQVIQRYHQIFQPKESHQNDLIPEELYSVEEKEDGSKIYHCKNCTTIGKSEKGMKQHITKAHKNQPLKKSFPVDLADSDTSDTDGKKKRGFSDDDILINFELANAATLSKF